MPDAIVAPHGFARIGSASSYTICWQLKMSRVQSRQQLPCVIGQNVVLLVKSGCGEPDGLLQPLSVRPDCDERTAPFRAALQTTVKTFSSAEVISFYEHKRYNGTIEMASRRGQKGMEKGRGSEEGH